MTTPAPPVDVAEYRGEVATVKMTGKTYHDEKSYPGELRFYNGELQERWECHATDHDTEQSHNWKEWRPVPSVTE